jgi:hypothetical protein
VKKYAKNSIFIIKNTYQDFPNREAEDKIEAIKGSRKAAENFSCEIFDSDKSIFWGMFSY